MAHAGQAGAVGFRAKELRGVPELEKRSRSAAPLSQPTERAVRRICEVDAEIDSYAQSAGTPPLRPPVMRAAWRLVSARRTRSQYNRRSRGRTRQVEYQGIQR